MSDDLDLLLERGARFDLACRRILGKPYLDTTRDERLAVFDHLDTEAADLIQGDPLRYAAPIAHQLTAAGCGCTGWDYEFTEDGRPDLNRVTVAHTCQEVPPVAVDRKATGMGGRPAPGPEDADTPGGGGR